ncbi:MAG: hypothetical protein MR368_00625 [Azospirillum sp.]|nr:hypothetical protein [Azospirillum sp.]
MGIFTKLSSLFKKKAVSQEWQKSNQDTTVKEKHPGMVKTCLRLSKLVVHPSDMLEELSIAFVTDCRKSIIFSAAEIRLFDMFDKNEFIGSFYALERNGFYYGNIVGRKEIVACEVDAFTFVETNRVVFPLAYKGQLLQAFVYAYDRKNGKLTPLFFGDFENGTCKEILHDFSPEDSVKQAFDYCKSAI